MNMIADVTETIDEFDGIVIERFTEREFDEPQSPGLHVHPASGFPNPPCPSTVFPPLEEFWVPRHVMSASSSDEDTNFSVNVRPHPRTVPLQGNQHLKFDLN
jgi:hypothetical protein